LPPARTQRWLGHRALVAALLGAEEHVLELHHAGIGEQQGRVVARHQRAGRHDGVALGLEEIEEVLADLVAGFHGGLGLGFGIGERRCAGQQQGKGEGGDQETIHVKLLAGLLGHPAKAAPLRGRGQAARLVAGGPGWACCSSGGQLDERGVRSRRRGVSPLNANASRSVRRAPAARVPVCRVVRARRACAGPAPAGAAGALQAEQGGVGGLALFGVLAGGLAEFGGAAFDVEQVVADLEGEAEGAGEFVEGGYQRGCRRSRRARPSSPPRGSARRSSARACA
jgi:hypothetical protein